jgi:hypothetical protein
LFCRIRVKWQGGSHHHIQSRTMSLHVLERDVPWTWELIAFCAPRCHVITDPVPSATFKMHGHYFQANLVIIILVRDKLELLLDWDLFRPINTFWRYWTERPHCPWSARDVLQVREVRIRKPSEGRTKASSLPENACVFDCHLWIRRVLSWWLFLVETQRPGHHSYINVKWLTTCEFDPPPPPPPPPPPHI